LLQKKSKKLYLFHLIIYLRKKTSIM